MDIGKRLRELRKQNGLTLQQLINLIGSGSTGFLSDIECNRTIPSIPKLEEICKALNITISDFFKDIDSEIEPSKALPPELKDLLNNAENLTPSQLKLIKNLIKEFNK